MELLSPVGNIKSLKAAINAGSDAVYLAGKNFGARSFAGNFTNEELKDAINICHLYGVKVYVTANTLILDSEVKEFMEYIDFLYQSNVDAIIMQDLGMIDLVRKTYPLLEIHASTQLHIHNLEGVKLCEKLGIKRVVLARETPIELIKYIKKHTNIEIEIFIHGALCMSYSGQCLMSSLIGNRSGNRGTCAQPCRQPYNLVVDGKVLNQEKYLLSTKDLNTLKYIGDLVDIGVDSLKIEGRMKSSEYVYLVTSLYKKALNDYENYGKIDISDLQIKNLKKVFNREFTKGFLNNEENDNFVNNFRPNHIGIKIGDVLEYKKNLVTFKLTDDLNLNDGIRIIGLSDVGMSVNKLYKNKKSIVCAKKNEIVSVPLKIKVNKNDIVLKTTDFKFMNELKELINKDKKIEIDGVCILKVNEPIKLFITDGENIIEVLSDYIIENAKKTETSHSIIFQHLNKLGDTIYIFKNLKIEKDENIFVPINIINELRRKAIEGLSEKRMYEKEYQKQSYKICLNDYDFEQTKSILIHDVEQYDAYKNEFDVMYIDNIFEFNKIKDSKVALKIPRVLEKLPNYNQKLLVGELGSVYKYSNIDTDFSLNVFNSYTVAFLHSIGVNKIVLSYELNYNQIKNLINEYHLRYNKHPNVEVIVSGFEEAMVCKYNMLNKYNVEKGILVDRFNNEYRVEYKDNLMYIYNYKKRNLKDDYYSIGVNSIRINI